jgi:hypothetical protein
VVRSLVHRLKQQLHEAGEKLAHKEAALEAATATAKYTAIEELEMQLSVYADEIARLNIILEQVTLFFEDFWRVLPRPFFPPNISTTTKSVGQPWEQVAPLRGAACRGHKFAANTGLVKLCFFYTCFYKQKKGSYCTDVGQRRSPSWNATMPLCAPISRQL